MSNYIVSNGAPMYYKGMGRCNIVAPVWKI